jgi:zinc transporter, ZIP family
VTALGVGLAALGTALATGLGALPFVGRAGRVTTAWLGAADAVAAGVMLAASLSLLLEGIGPGAGRTAVGAAVGAAFVGVARRLLAGRPAVSFGVLHGASARRGILLVAVMTVHSFAEGAGIGAAFGGGKEFGVVVTIAIAIHNIPEGLAISLVLVPHGASARAAAGWSIVSSLPQPLVAVPAFLFVATFTAMLPAALGFAAGAMAWIAVRDLVPDALAHAPRRTVALDATGAFAAMFAFQLLLFA